MKTNIALIGFMATGKTSVAKSLAKKLNKKYVSTDELIVRKAKKSVQRIFTEDGEIRFREIEIEVVKEVSSMQNVVIDCGGGVVLNKINIDRLRKSSIIILLTATPDEILKRSLKQKGERPLLEVKDRRKKIIELLDFRRPFYERSADYKIDTSNLTVEEVVEKIIQILKGENHGYAGKKE